MKQLFILLLFFSLSISGQNFEKVDVIVKEYPRFSKVEDLSNQIEKDFTKDIDKVRAAFFWLTQNIRYNLKELYNPQKRSYRFKYSSEKEKNQKLQAIKDKLIADTFRNKTGVCEEYAQSFKKICDLLNIEAAVIKGYVRNDVSEIGLMNSKTNHAWNAVKINEKWQILDATWASGFEYNGKWIRKFNSYFFNMPVDKIFKTHYPEETIWVLRFGRMSLKDFYLQPIYNNSFLNLNTHLISPQKGIINITHSENIELKFKNLDAKAIVYYTIKGNKYAQKPIIKTDKNITTLIIQNPNRNTDLIIYINNKDALHFKVKMK